VVLSGDLENTSRNSIAAAADRRIVSLHPRGTAACAPASAKEGILVNSTHLTLTATAPVVVMPVNWPASRTSALGGGAVAVGTAVPAGFLRKTPVGALAGDKSVDFRIQDTKVAVRTDGPAVTGINARRSHIEKYVPGIPPRGRPV
jgi:hypothetical protein